MNFVKVIRNNWKKAIALSGVGILGFSFVQKKYRSVELFQVCV